VGQRLEVSRVTECGHRLELLKGFEQLIKLPCIFSSNDPGIFQFSLKSDQLILQLLELLKGPRTLQVIEFFLEFIDARCCLLSVIDQLCPGLGIRLSGGDGAFLYLLEGLIGHRQLDDLLALLGEHPGIFFTDGSDDFLANLKPYCRFFVASKLHRVSLEFRDLLVEALGQLVYLLLKIGTYPATTPSLENVIHFPPALNISVYSALPRVELVNESLRSLAEVL